MISETFAPERFEGRGFASRIAKHVIADASEHNLLILPVCPYFSAYLRKHPEQAEVVQPTYRSILDI